MIYKIELILLNILRLFSVMKCLLLFLSVSCPKSDLSSNSVLWMYPTATGAATCWESTFPLAIDIFILTASIGWPLVSSLQEKMGKATVSKPFFPTTVCLPGLPLGRNIPHLMQWHEFLLGYMKTEAYGIPRCTPEMTWSRVGERKGRPCRENGDQDWDRVRQNKKENVLLIKIRP